MMMKILSFLKKKTRPGSTDRNALMDTFQAKYINFKALLNSNSELLKIISDIEEKLRGETSFGTPYIEAQTIRTIFHAGRMIKSLEDVSGREYPDLTEALDVIHSKIKQEQGLSNPARLPDLILPYSRIDRGVVESVGEKNANTGEVRNRVGLSVPEGFAITTTAFERFMESNHLTEEVRQMKTKVDVISPETVMRVSQDIQERLLSGVVPEDLREAIRAAYEGLSALCPEKSRPVKVSLRSSAIGEDSVLSFAGQYLTVLNIPPENIFDEYKKIVASLFTPRAISYRLHMGIPFSESAMAVACQEMIPAKVSGVMYTRNPVNPLENRIIINAVWGLGPYAVDGVITPDSYMVLKQNPPVIEEVKVSEKRMRMVTRAAGYTSEEPVEDEIRRLPCLTEDCIRTLAGYGMRLEDHFQCAQDVEWAVDDRDRLIILQARPLRIENPLETEGSRLAAGKASGYTVLLEGGDVVCQGVGFGPVHHVRTEEDLIHFPEGAVLVASHSSPQFVMVMDKARAIVTDSGNITGHMAALAREYMVPSVLNTKTATARLAQNTEVTVDAYSARVYLGKVPELIESRIRTHGFLKNTPLYRALRNRADLIVPLNLVDPKSPRFNARNCKTIHDIMRLVHELSYAEVFQMGDLITDYGKISRRLNAPLPLDLYVIDLGKGLREGKPSASVSVDQVLSVPFAALLKGMLREDLRNRGPIPVAFKGFMSVLSRQMLSPPNLPVERFGDRSYAIVSDKYLNFSSRVGYHYSVLDAYCGKTGTKNYINFQFKGGAADDVRRNRRARLIQQVLSTSGFQVETTGDRVVARFGKHESGEIEERLDQLGRLLMYTRQMDMLMNSEECVSRMADSFLRGDYRLDGFVSPDFIPSPASVQNKMP